MRALSFLVLSSCAILIGGAFRAAAAEKGEKQVAPVLNFTMDSLDGKPVDLSKYQGKVILMVNVASKCGLTPQYKGLQALHDKYAKDGLVILGFPANNFGHQEPGSNKEISEFCKENYGVAFDMFSKVSVRGDDQCALYKFLTSKETNPKFPGQIKWNFEKFLINPKGEIVNRFVPTVTPGDPKVTKAIEEQIAQITQ